MEQLSPLGLAHSAPRFLTTPRPMPCRISIFSRNHADFWQIVPNVKRYYLLCWQNGIYTYLYIGWHDHPLCWRSDGWHVNMLHEKIIQAILQSLQRSTETPERHRGPAGQSHLENCIVGQQSRGGLYHAGLPVKVYTLPFQTRENQLGSLCANSRMGKHYIHNSQKHGRKCRHCVP